MKQRRLYLITTVIFFLLATIIHAQGISLSWKIQGQKEVGTDSINMYKPGYNTSSWLAGTVPGTVFGDYVKTGKEADPNYADNIYKVDRTKYNRNFWYRSEFLLPAGYSQEKTWLNFEGINSKGDVFFNGIKLGTLDGFMRRGKYDVTSLLKTNTTNVIAVLVYLPVEPIVNWASPTYMASGGWDWMPYVPGLNMGITDDVYFSNSGKISIADPWIRTIDLTSNNTKASLSLITTLNNTSAASQTGTLSGVIKPGNITFSQKITLPAGNQKTVTLGKVLNNPKLWWPNGYGDPNLYTCDLKFVVSNKTSDSTRLTFGIRKYTYDTLGSVLHISVNGTRIFLKGGNWGMSEYMLRCRGKDYDYRLRFHKEMGMNMIRNWLGSTTDDEFYTACDKYGVMVWDDFWLNNFFTAIRDTARFDANVNEKVIRYRNHASLALWCGDNEGYPFTEQNTAMQQAVALYDLNDRLYHPCSNQGNLSGSGLWTNFPPAQYFSSPANFSSSTWGLRSEMGTAVFTNFESFKQFIPEANWWPRNPMWDKHFFSNDVTIGGGASPDTYMNSIATSYGSSGGIQEFCRKAQLLNIETNKAMFEGWQDHIWNDASGLLVWMSQSAFPSMIWQTYDYYYDCTGAYWGIKKACEPVHIQWSVASDSVKVINTSGAAANGLTATAKVYNLDGSEVTALSSTKAINAVQDTATYCFNVFTKDNLAYRKTASASSVKNGNLANLAFDGSNATRWESNYNDNQWIYVDLGSVQPVSSVQINWEGAYGKSYKLQVSNDAVTWTDMYSTTAGDGGVDTIAFTQTNTRYVKMQGVKRGTVFGYSILDMAVYGPNKSNLSNTHFLKLELKDASGKLVSDNFYWRNKSSLVYTDLNTLPIVSLTVNSAVKTSGSQKVIDATITNPSTSAGVAFAIRVQVVKASTGERILPVYLNDNYFTLLKGESKALHVEFDTSLLGGDQPRLLIEQYSQGNASSTFFVAPSGKPSIAVPYLEIGNPYPNPFRDKIILPVTTKTNGTANVIIYDARGNVVQQFTHGVVAGMQTIAWESSSFASGAYTIGIYLPGGAMKSRKVIKM